MPSTLVVARGRLLIRISDRHARYPLDIDPLIRTRYKLTGGGEVGAGAFGAHVALSADGRTALIGAARDDGSRGAAWVFERTSSGWAQKAKLTGRGLVGIAGFGFSVALSADGDTAVVGAPAADGKQGAVWIFTRNGSNWKQPGQKLTARGEIGAGEFGFSVAVSADGDTALIGGPDDSRPPGYKGNIGHGAAWVFTRAGSVWIQQGQKLSGTAGTPVGELGSAVALSADGNTALVGAPNQNDTRGAAWVFTRAGSAWEQSGRALAGAGEIGPGAFGSAVALSANGSTALIGAGDNNNNRGAVWVFTQKSSAWVKQAGPLTGRSEIGPATFGATVALSTNGTTALVGGYFDNHGAGATWLMRRQDAKWVEYPKLTTEVSAFGGGVALSADGATALIGGYEDNNGRGAAWVFTFS